MIWAGVMLSRFSLVNDSLRLGTSCIDNALTGKMRPHAQRVVPKKPRRFTAPRSTDSLNVLFTTHLLIPARETFAALAYLAAKTHTLSGAKSSEFESSVCTF